MLVQVFYDGIPYLNHEQEEFVKQHWKHNAVLSTAGEMDFCQRDLLRKYCSVIARWLVQAREGDIYTYDKSAGNHSHPFLSVYLSVYLALRCVLCCVYMAEYCQFVLN